MLLDVSILLLFINCIVIRDANKLSVNDKIIRIMDTSAAQNIAKYHNI